MFLVDFCVRGEEGWKEISAQQCYLGLNNVIHRRFTFLHIFMFRKSLRMGSWNSPSSSPGFTPRKNVNEETFCPKSLDCEPQYNFVKIKQVTVTERPCPAFFVRRCQVWHFLNRHLAALFTCCSSSLIHLSLSFFYSIFAFFHHQMIKWWGQPCSWNITKYQKFSSVL